MKRRDFLQKTSLAGLTAAVGSTVVNAQTAMPMRPYGDTGIMLSCIGFGGIVVRDVEPEHAQEVVAKAVEQGINYFDVAPTYGNAEERLGPALEPFRDQVFLAEKTQKRDAEGAKQEMEESLEKLRTDHFDLYQLHALSEMEDVEEAFAKGGCMETFIKAREEGVVKYLGFSAHNDKVAIEAMNRFDFDSILFPFNFSTWHQGSFGPEVMRVAQQKNVARLALKAMARNRWTEGADRSAFPKCWYEPVTDDQETEMALKFTLSLDVTAAVPPGEEVLFWRAVDFAKQSMPIQTVERDSIQQLAMNAKPVLFQTSL